MRQRSAICTNATQDIKSVSFRFISEIPGIQNGWDANYIKSMDYAKNFLKGSIENTWASVDEPYNQLPAGNTEGKKKKKTTLLKEEIVGEFDRFFSCES